MHKHVYGADVVVDVAGYDIACVRFVVYDGDCVGVVGGEVVVGVISVSWLCCWC